MRRLIPVAVGVMLVMGVLAGPRRGEAVINNCSVSGDYKLSGFALGNTEVFGFVTFTPNGPCDGGTFGGSVTVKVDANPAVTFAPSGTYVVNGDTTITINNTGGETVNLTGNVSQVVNDVANAIHVAGDVSGAINVGLTMTRANLSGPTLLTGGSFGLDLSFSGGTAHRCGPGNGCSPTGAVGLDIAVPVSAGTVRNLRVDVDTGPGVGQSITFTVERNGTDLAVSCVISGTAATCSDTTNAVVFVDGDLLSVVAIPSSMATPDRPVRYSLVHQP